MKIKSTLFVFAAVAAVAGLSEAAEVVSPLLSGFHPDPSVTRGADGAYYLVTSTFMWSPGLPVYRSDDFRTWSRVGHALPDIASVIEPGDEFTDDDGVRISRPSSSPETSSRTTTESGRRRSGSTAERTTWPSRSTARSFATI